MVRWGEKIWRRKLHRSFTESSMKELEKSESRPDSCSDVLTGTKWWWGEVYYRDYDAERE